MWNLLDEFIVVPYQVNVTILQCRDLCNHSFRREWTLQCWQCVSECSEQRKMSQIMCNRAQHGGGDIGIVMLTACWGVLGCTSEMQQTTVTYANRGSREWVVHRAGHRGEHRFGCVCYFNPLDIVSRELHNNRLDAFNESATAKRSK